MASMFTITEPVKFFVVWHAEEQMYNKRHTDMILQDFVTNTNSFFQTG